MSTGYAIAYRLGVTPWERAGREATAQFNALLDREQEGDPPFGRALDIGCGTGDHAVNLARRGWDVTGVDFVSRALQAARARRRRRASTSGSCTPTSRPWLNKWVVATGSCSTSGASADLASIHRFSGVT